VLAPGQVVTVFRSRLRPDALEEYAATAALMSSLAAAMPGYVDHKAFIADDGERVTVVTFRDRASHDAWRTHLEHRTAQRRGREAFYTEFSLQVAEVTSVTLMTEKDPASPRVLGGAEPPGRADPFRDGAG
jgi:heme-degrading monooxygenase HmoA